MEKLKGGGETRRAESAESIVNRAHLQHFGELKVGELATELSAQKGEVEILLVEAGVENVNVQFRENLHHLGLLPVN